MKRICFKLVICLFLLCLVCGCKEHSLTYEYLMQNPSELQKAMTHCEFSVIENTECEVVKRAANDFGLLLAEHESNPEQFGEKILKAQEQLAIKKHEVSSHADELQEMNLKILMAIVAMTTWNK